MFLHTKDGGKVSFTINAAAQVYKKTIEFVYFGGAICTSMDLAHRRLTPDFTFICFWWRHGLRQL